MRRLIRFCMVGGVTAVIHYGVLLTLVECFHWQSTLGSSVGFVVAVVCNYAMHYSWTFAAEVTHQYSLSRYLVMVGTGFFLNAGVMYSATEWLGVQYVIAQLVALVIVLGWNFTVANRWVFRRST